MRPSQSFHTVMFRWTWYRPPGAHYEVLVLTKEAWNAWIMGGKPVYMWLLCVNIKQTITGLNKYIFKKIHAPHLLLNNTGRVQVPCSDWDDEALEVFVHCVSSPDVFDSASHIWTFWVSAGHWISRAPVQIERRAVTLTECHWSAQVFFIPELRSPKFGYQRGWRSQTCY